MFPSNLSVKFPLFKVILFQSLPTIVSQRNDTWGLHCIFINPVFPNSYPFSSLILKYHVQLYKSPGETAVFSLVYNGPLESHFTVCPLISWNRTVTSGSWQELHDSTSCATRSNTSQVSLHKNSKINLPFYKMC
jgi:hypothetical protein